MKGQISWIKNIKGPVAVLSLILISLFLIFIISIRDATPVSGVPIMQFVSFDPGEQLILFDNNQTLQIGKALEYLPDHDNKLELEDILSEEYNSRFRPLWDEGITSKYFPYYDGLNKDTQAVWVRLTIKDIYIPSPVLLTTPFNSTILHCYIPDNKGSYNVAYRRIEAPWRLFTNDPEIYIQLPTEISERTPVYIKMETRFKRRIKLEFSAMESRDYTNEFSLISNSKGMFIGFFAAILIFHIFLYIITKEEKYFYYILFMFFLMINRMITTHISLWKYWAGMFYLENLIYSLFLAGLQIFGLHFIRKTLVNRYDTRRMAYLNRITNHLYSLYIFWAILSGIMNIPHLYKQIIITIMVGINMIMVYQYIMFALAKGNRMAILYFIAFTPFFIFELLFTLAFPVYQMIQNLIPFMPIRYLTDFIQCTILAIAVGQDIVRYKVEKEISGQILRDRLQNENRYLENEVENRTRDLKEAISSAELANAAKSRFLANISHELRTPLGGIIGFAELINKTDDPAMQKQYNKKILAESGHLLNLISDVLNLSRIESGNYEIETSAFVLRDRVQDSLAGQAVLIREKGLEYDLILHDSLPEVVLGDPNRLRQVLLNLTNNAQKFTNKGYVKVVVQPVTSPIDNTILIRFEIKDTGVGISEQKAAKIFQPFYQVDHSISRNHDGTGLGTTISKKLVELMGGDIGYTPNHPRGSIFWFSLPFVIGSRENILPDENTQLIHGKGKILIVDDYQTNREITSTFLESLGYTTSLAEDGYKALSLCSREEYDLILMDIHMPMLNGYETVEKLAQNSPLNETTPVLMLTAGGFDDESKEKIRGNIKGIIYKPVQLKDISYQVAAILNPDALNEEEPVISGDRGFSFTDFLNQFENRKDGEEIFRGFLSHCRENLDSLFGDISCGDFISLHRKVHAIKGGALNIGLQELADKAGALEKYIKDTDYLADRTGHQAEDHLKEEISGLYKLLAIIETASFTRT